MREITFERFISDDQTDGVEAIPNVIWKENIFLFAIGSRACVRNLYFRARASNHLHLFQGVIIGNLEYAVGGQSKRMAASLNGVLERKDLTSVIIYTSCMEVISCFDFEQILESLSNKYNIEIRVLNRGPMIKRRENVRENFKKLVGTLEKNNGQIKDKNINLPPIACDFEGISEILEEENSEIQLLTPGGCVSCLRRCSKLRGDKLYFSRFSDLDVTLGLEEGVAKGLGRLSKDEKIQELNILGTSIPSFIGTDYPLIQNTLEQEDLAVNIYETNGNTSAPVFMSNMYEKIVKDSSYQFKKLENKEKSVLILGHSTLYLGERERLNPMVEALKDCGIKVEYFSFKKKNYEVSHTWVLSSEALKLAQHLKENRQIDCLKEIPIGLGAQIEFINKIFKRSSKRKIHDEKRYQNKKILIIAEPILSSSLCDYFEHVFQMKTTLATYTDDLDTKRFYELNQQNRDLVVIEDEVSLGQAMEEKDLVVADPIFKEYYTEMVPKGIFIGLPQSLISGSVFADEEYQLYGKDGDEYLNQFASLEKLTIREPTSER